jgi:hypothetical protein
MTACFKREPGSLFILKACSIGYSPGKMTFFSSQAPGKPLILWNLTLERVWREEICSPHSAGIFSFTPLTKVLIFFFIKV